MRTVAFGIRTHIGPGGPAYPGGSTLRNVVSHARAGLLALAVLLMGSVLLASPASAHQGDITTPTPVTVNVEFGDNVCVGNVYSEPSMNAPQFPGTTQAITGTVAPGSTVEVVYTALDGFVIDGQSTFTHTFPAEPSSVTDCEKAVQPEPLVRDRSKVRTDCGGVARREWDIVTAYVWNGSAWVLGEPEVRDDTGWIFVRALTRVEQQQLGCLDVGGEEGNDDGNHNDGGEVVPTVQVGPAQEAAPTQETKAVTVPVAVDAGLSDAAVAPAPPRWLAPFLGGVIMLGFAGFWRLKSVATL